MLGMRIAALRPLLVAGAIGLTALVGAAPAGAHGGTTLAQGGADGVSILAQAAETTTPAGREAVDLSTTIEGPGTGDGATVTYWIRPAGGETFRARAIRDDAGIAHTDVPTAGRGDWRSWDVSAVVDLSTGKRLRVSNAESNPPGPDPAATPGGGATGADEDEAPATTTEDAPASGGTAPDTATGDAPATTADATPETGGADADSSDTGAIASAIEDVSGDDGGTPGWVVPSGIVVLAAAVALVLVVQRRRRAAEVHGQDD